MSLEVFELEVIINNPIFEGFGLLDNASLLNRDNLLEDLIPGYGNTETSKFWKVPRLSESWSPPRVGGRVRPFNDFPGINMVLPAFSEKACNNLKELLEPNGELLPLQFEEGNYFFYNITTIYDAFDIENAEAEFWCDPPTTALDIEKYAFKANEIGASIFRIYENPIATLVTNEFVQKVEQECLNGFNFKRLWPLPEGLGHKEYNETLVTKNNNKDHTLLVRLKLKNDRPNNTEKGLISAFEDELDALLFTPSINSKYFGSYEGHDIVDGEYRIFVCGPDVDDLAMKIERLLLNLTANFEILVTKRYGGMFDINSEEVDISY